MSLRRTLKECNHKVEYDAQPLPYGKSFSIPLNMAIIRTTTSRYYTYHNRCDTCTTSHCWTTVESDVNVKPVAQPRDAHAEEIPWLSQNFTSPKISSMLSGVLLDVIAAKLSNKYLPLFGDCKDLSYNFQKHHVLQSIMDGILWIVDLEMVADILNLEGKMTKKNSKITMPEHCSC